MQGRCSRATVVVGAAALALAPAACGLDPASPADPEAGAVSQAFTGGQCPEFGCGANSPVIDTQFDFHDLSLLGDARPAAATLPNTRGPGDPRRPRHPPRADRRRAGVPYDLRVADGRFIGSNCRLAPCRHAAGPGPGRCGHPDVGGKVPFQIAITSVRSMGYFLDPGVRSTAIETYTLMWNAAGHGAPTNLCNNIAAARTGAPAADRRER